jgi:hypothetical protein
LVLRDTTAAVNRGGVNITWTAGVPSAVATEGTLEGVDAYPSGWYRIRIVATGVVAANVNQFRFSPDTAVGTNNTIFWGAQTENGAFATSYIPTTTAALTRNTDQPSIVAPMFAPWFNTPAGTFVLTYRQLASTSAQIKAVAIVSDGTSSNRVYTYVGSAPAGAPTLLVTSAGVAQVTSTNAVIASNTSVKTASTYSANDFAIVTNGGTVATDTSGTVPTGITSLGIGVLVTGGSPLNGHIARLDYYPTRLTNAQLQALTL